MKKPVILCILDGIAYSESEIGNAYAIAKTPTLDMLKQNFPTTHLDSSGLAVGLPEGQMGNSEVGHLNIGAGRVIYQSLTRIDQAIVDRSFFEDEVLNEAFSKASKTKKKIHLMGLFSNGGVHSQLNHLRALVEMANLYQIDDILVHAFLDGRDVGFNIALQDLQSFMNDVPSAKIATLSGRYYAMDRDQRFERNQLCLDALLQIQGPSFENPIEYLEASYSNNVFDEFVLPAYNTTVNGQIQADDVVISFNFRPDRMIQLGSILTNPAYTYPLSQGDLSLHFVTMMAYANTVLGPVVFKKSDVQNPLGVYLANLGLNQLRIAETEKYAHVTFFFDGQVKYDGIENPELQNCDRILVPSPKVATYDLKPEMSAQELTDKLLVQLDKTNYDLVVLNYANCDMVGHTGNIDAAIIAVETIDTCVKRLYDKVEELGGVMLITADHGNCEQMLDADGKKLTNHTTNPVEMIITSKDVKLNHGKLADIAPTICTLLEVAIPEQMSGNCLIQK